MCCNTRHPNQAEHPQLQVFVTTTTVPGELYSSKQGSLFLTVAEDVNNATTGGCCNCVGNRKRKSLVASLTELLSRAWAVRECRVVTNDWDMLMTPRVRLNPHQPVCQHVNASSFTTSQRGTGEREREVIELEGNHTYEHNRR